MQSSAEKIGRTRGMSLGFTVPPPHASIAVSVMKIIEKTVGYQKKQYHSAITEHHSDGIVRWGFDIDDDSYQKKGFPVPKDYLPTVRFKFIGDSVKPAPPAPPPKCMDIAITSYWSIIPPNKSTTTWIQKVLHFFKSTGNSRAGSRSRVIPFSNLFQVVALTADLSNLPEPSESYYRANVKLKSESGISDDPDIKRVANSVYVTPVVVDGMT